MGRPRKETYTTRDPQVTVRDPVIETERQRVVQQRQARRYIPASMPTVCFCGGNTRMANGRHIDEVRRTILEYRTCSRCGAKLAAGRTMTEREQELLCGHAEAVKDYEDTIK